MNYFNISLSNRILSPSAAKQFQRPQNSFVVIKVHVGVRISAFFINRRNFCDGAMFPAVFLLSGAQRRLHQIVT